MRRGGGIAKLIERVKGNFVRLWFPLAMSSLILFAFILCLYSEVNHDSSWFLYGTARFLEGARLYVDLIEINPPLPFYIMVPPVALARLIPLEPELIFYLYVFCLAGVSLVLSAYLMAGLPTFTKPLKQIALLAMGFAMLILPSFDFGQREHLLIVFTLPYVLLAMRRAGGFACDRRSAIVVSAFAFFGFALKPYFLLVPVALEIYLLILSRDLLKCFRSETITLGAALVTYFGVIYYFTPDYVSTIIPYALEVYNQAYQRAWTEIFMGSALFPLMICLLYIRAPYVENLRSPLGLVFLISGVAYIVICLYQAKGWHYQSYPAIASLFIALIVRATDYLPALKSAIGGGSIKAFELPLWFFLSLLILILLPYRAIEHRSYHDKSYEMLAPVILSHGPISSLFIFSTNVSAGFPLTNRLGAHWSSRFATLWLMPGIMRRRHELKQKPDLEASPLLDEIERYNKEAVISDLTGYPPQLVAIDTRKDKSYFGSIDFDYLDYFMADPRFRAFWEDYEKIGDFGIFAVYHRRAL